MDDRLKAVSMRSTVRRVPGAHRSRYESSCPATFTSRAPGSSAPPCGRIESASAARVARRAAVKGMPCDYGPAMATKRLRLLLRIWTVIFLLGAVDFFVFPYLTVKILNSTARSLGMHQVTALNGGQDFWLTLAVPYMILVAALSWIAQRGTRIQAQPVQFLLLAKAASSLTSLALFLLGGFAYPFLASYLAADGIVVDADEFYPACRLDLVEASQHPAAPTLTKDVRR